MSGIDTDWDKITDEGWVDNVPDGGRIYAHVWSCGDVECDCTQAQIVHWASTQNGTRLVNRSTLWHGTYYIDRDWTKPTRELNREARRLRKKHNELFHRIEWPWDRKAAG